MGSKSQAGRPITLPYRGINLHNSVYDHKDGEAIETQNMYYRRGLQGRVGWTRTSPNQVSGNNPIVGLHRFYSSVSTRILFATSNTVTTKLNGDGTWTNIRTGLTANTPQNINTWGFLNKAYFANGVDVPFESDGTTTATQAQAPATALVLLPYRSRLLSIERANPSDIRWSTPDYATPTGWTTTAEALRMFGPGAIEVLAHHGLQSDKGFDEKVLVCKPTSSALLSGFDFTVGGSPSEFLLHLDEVSNTIGSSSIRTVVSTPIGTLLLGSNRQVYLLPYGSFEFIPVGHKIQSNCPIKGIESIPIGMLSSACAVYEDGFYKLSISTGSATNDTQFWLDVDRFTKDEEDGLYGPWYGPFTDPDVSMFALQNGSGDDSRLIAGSYNGYVNTVNTKGIYSDNGAAITFRWQDIHRALAGTDKNFKLNKTELELTSFLNDLKMSFFDTNSRAVGNQITIPGTAAGVYFDEAFFDEEYFESDEQFVRVPVNHYGRNLIGRALSMVLEYGTAVDPFIIGFVQHDARALKRRLPPDTTNIQ